jgi:hypothetical protein
MQFLLLNQLHNYQDYYFANTIMLIKQHIIAVQLFLDLKLNQPVY